MSQYNIIAESSEYTVVSEYEHTVNTSDAYQSEADLEKEFIHLLGEQGYEYLNIHTEADLVSNLRRQLEKLNSYTFTDNEWEHFFNENLANKNDDIVAKTAKIQEDYIQVLKRDTGESQNIYLIDKNNIHNKQKAEDLKELIESENLKPEETVKFIESSFRDGQVRTTGTDIDRILPPMSRFGGGNRQEKKKSVIEKIQIFFERYFGL